LEIKIFIYEASKKRGGLNLGWSSERIGTEVNCVSSVLNVKQSNIYFSIVLLLNSYREWWNLPLSQTFLHLSIICSVFGYTKQEEFLVNGRFHSLLDYLD
jgi:hypothetical protein